MSFFVSHLSKRDIGCGVFTCARICVAAAFLLVVVSCTRSAEQRNPTEATTISEKDDTKQGPNAEKKQPEVVLQKIDERVFRDELVYGGRLVAGEAREVVADMEGYLEKVFVKNGDFVQPGQVIAILNPPRSRGVFNPSKVTAPRPGIVSGFNARPGNWVTSNTVLGAIRSADLFEIRTHLLPEEISLTQPGKAGSWYVSFPKVNTQRGAKSPAQAHDASVSPNDEDATNTFSVVPQSLDRTADAQTGLIPALFTLDCRAIKKKESADWCRANAVPGIPVRISYIIAERRSPFISADALHAGPRSVIRVKDSKAVYTPLSLGKRDSDHIEVTEGLKAGDTIVQRFDRLPQDGEAIVVQAPGPQPEPNADPLASSEKDSSSKE